MKRFMFKLLIISFTFSISIFAGNISNEEIKEWKSIGIQDYEISKWLRLKINTPEEAKQWIDAGFNHYYTQEWKYGGVNTPEEAKKWKELNNRIEKLKKQIMKKMQKK